MGWGAGTQQGQLGRGEGLGPEWFWVSGEGGGLRIEVLCAFNHLIEL